ncbi:Ig-like domain-containing protein, partial [Leeuwenhoekiella sp. NPDC079379]|uniref:Ig-like domain-containing protein n=1 Tax=Leeuwenhoekiella sp. NPDC079379 TaxID=3364122 RepID=UPI0037C5F22C
MKIKITLSLLGFLIVGGIFTGQAQLKNSFDVRYSETLRGNFTTIANNNMSRNATAAYTGENGNHDFDDNVYVDIDSDVTTFNSSSAALTTVGTGSCVSIRKVYLYWTAGDKEPGDRNSSDNQPSWNYNQVKLKLPRQTAYTTLTADEVLYRGRTEHFSNDPYACVKDITSLVQGIGDYTGSYTVANVEAKTGTIIGHQGANGGDIIGASAGWQIVVVYENTNLPARNVTIFDGFANVTRNNGENNYDIRVEGFRTIPVGAVNADVVFGALEGDRDLTGDRLQIRNASNSYTDISTALRPADNFFNSRITRYGQDVTNRVPASTNTLGFDAGVFTLNNPNNSLLGNDQTSTILRLTSTQETYSLYMVGLAVEVYEPELSPLLLTTNLGAQNELIIDQTVRATFQVKNYGNDDMKNLSISYVVPSSVNYVPNASLLPSGVTVNYVAGTRTLNFGFADNIVEVGDAVLSVGFDLKASSDCSLAGTQFNLQLSANYRGVKNNTQKTTLSSSALSGACPVGNLQPSRITLVASGACKPTAVNDSASTQVDSPLNIDVVINDNFGGDGPASQAIVVTSNPSNGTAVVDTNGTPNDPTDDTILYTPALGYVGSDSFTYTIKDANGDTSTATVDVTVSNVIVTPPGQRNCDCAPFYQNSNFVNPVRISGTNLQPGAVYRFSNVFTDSPSPIDALVKIVKFNNGASLLNIDVAGQGVPANFQPQIKSSTNGDQSVEFEITFVTGGGNYGNEVVISFFGTPFDIDGDSQRTREYAELSLPDAYYQSADTQISIQRKIGSVRGTAINPTTAPGGDISSDARYTFSNYWEGKSKLNYTIGKENGNSDRYYSLALKNANYANPQSTIVTAPVICGNVSDEGGDPLRGVKVNITGTDGSSATLSTDVNGNYRYQTSIPSALVDVTYTITETDLENYVSISDADGGPDFNKITRVVNLMSTCQNNFVDDGRPLAQDDAAQASPLRPIQPVNIRVLENDIFGPDGPSTGTITIVSQPAVGSAVVNNSGTPNDPTDDFITYNPPLLNLVPVQLSYQICDSDGDCDTAVVRIGILDDSPRAQDDQYTVSEDSQNNPLTVLVNDDFGNDGPGSLSVVSGPSNGTLTPNNNGTPGDLSDDFFTYTPNADYFGNDLFTYQICDADSPISSRECSTATVRILVAADPTLSVQPVQVVEGQPLEFVFTISDVSTEDVVIQVNTSDVSATAGLDYTAAVNQIITIPAGQLTANYVVNSLEDIIYENSEVFNIQGSVQTNNTRNLTVSTTGTITDNDGGAPTITIADVTVAEGADAVFVVTLDKPSYEDI